MMTLSLIAVLIVGAGPARTQRMWAPSSGPSGSCSTTGRPKHVDPRNDPLTKGTLFKSIGKDGTLTVTGLGGLMEPETLRKLAGADMKLDRSEINRALEATVPSSRKHLYPKVREHADYLTTTFDMIDEPHRLAGQKFVDWLADNYRPGRPLDVTVVCTGNSRRSIFGATTGNIAAAYYGLPEIRFHSGGTAPTAFNSRTIVALKAIGVEVEPTGKEAKRGEPKTANPIYLVRWGKDATSSDTAFESTEFSKLYTDPANPRSGFVALMVCGEADAGCPVVNGADLRISMPYLDAKIYDGGAYESAKYAERRDDMGRLMLSVMMQVRRKLTGDAGLGHLGNP